MFMPDVELHQADSLEEAVALLKQHGPDARILAGGTDLVVDLKAGRATARHVITIRRVDSIKRIIEHDDALHVGALTTITQLDESPLVKKHAPSIRDATGSLAVRQIRNIATVGGNIASGTPCADLPPILIALGASLELWSPSGTRELPLPSFFLGPRRTARGADELLSCVLIPKHAADFGAAYARFGLREGNAIAVAAVAASFSLLPNGTIANPVIVLGSVAPVPKVAAKACAALEGATPGEDAFAAAAREARKEAEPISDVRGTADFRRELVEVLTRRALARAHNRAGGGTI